MATSRPARASAAPLRVAFFGLLGSGNLGNDSSLQAMLPLVRDLPAVEASCVCAGPQRVTSMFGIPAAPMHWHDSEGTQRRAAVWKAIGKLADAAHTFRWMRKLDVVIVPGMGVLETTLPLRPWGFPYALALVSLAGRWHGTKVALVSVGAADTQQPVIRWLFALSARLAHYRSYRDTLSRAAVSRMGVNTTRDEVYPDLAFALPTPGTTTRRPAHVVGVGVMAYHGTTNDGRAGDAIHRTYREAMRAFVSSLTERGYLVRLFGGDKQDDEVADAIHAEVASDRVSVARAGSFDELMRTVADVDVVVASRYHNLLGALKLGKPTISVSYGEKNDVLMADSGLGAYCHPIRSPDARLLGEQFDDLVEHRDLLVERINSRNTARMAMLDQQFAHLSATLLGGGRSRRPSRTPQYSD